jgi:hypothetical protein
VFSAGIDGRLVHYRSIKDSETGLSSWVIAGSSHFHTHDVRAICISGLFCPPVSNAHKGQVIAVDPSHPKGGPVCTPLDRHNLQRCVVSGGVDTQLCIYTYARVGESKMGANPPAATPVHRLPPWPHSRSVRFSGVVKAKNASEMRMLCWQHNEAVLWRWPITSSGAVQEPRYALKIHTWAGENVRCAGVHLFMYVHVCMYVCIYIVCVCVYIYI